MIRRLYERIYFALICNRFGWGRTLGPWRGRYWTINWHPYRESPLVYSSPNATPWHHDAKSLFGRLTNPNDDCCCAGCDAVRVLSGETPMVERRTDAA